jgi:site-specific recombinase XerD
LIRTEADAINAQLSSGINPNEQKKIDEALAITLQDAFDNYKDAKNLADKTITSYDAALDKMQTWSNGKAIKDWKDEPMRNISKQMVLDLYNRINKDSHSTAMKIAQVIRAVWNFTNDLTDNDAFGRSPTIILNKQKKKWSKTTTRNRKITNDDLPDWIKSVRNLPSNKVGEGKRMAAYLEFLLLTGLRRSEAAYLLWEDVNLKDGYFIVRNTKNHSDHCLPIVKLHPKVTH